MKFKEIIQQGNGGLCPIMFYNSIFFFRQFKAARICSLLFILYCTTGLSPSLYAQSSSYKGEIIEQYAPAQLALNETTTVWVKATNTGTITWLKNAPVGNRVMLAVPNDGAGHPWGFGRVLLDEDVPPGQTTTFTFQITGNQLGQVPFQWQLLREGHYRFGMPSALDQVQVIDQHFGGDELHHIGVRTLLTGEQELFHRETGATFTPRGANIVRNGATNHEMFNVGLYDAEQEALALYQLRKKGYNSIRVWISPNGVSDLDSSGNPIMNAAFITNVKNYLQRCREQKIYAQLTFSYFLGSDYNRLAVLNPQIAPRNAFYLDATYIDARTQIFTDFINALKGQSAPIGQVMSWNLVNEMKFREDILPLSQSSGTVTTVTGVYDLGNAAERDSLMYDAVDYCANEWTTQVKAVDSTSLCAIGWYSPLAVSAPLAPANPFITIPGVTALENTAIDIIDLHTYPNQTPERNLDIALASMGYQGQVEKVTILGEFGFLRDEVDVTGVVDSALYYMSRSCQLGIDGWMYWTWDPYGIDRFWSMIDNNDLIADAIAPVNYPTVCLATGGGVRALEQAETDSDSSIYLNPDQDAKTNADPVVKVYPNPVQDYLQVQWSKEAQPRMIALYNALGVQVWNVNKMDLHSNTSIDLSHLAAGVYYLKVFSSQEELQPLTYTIIHH